MIDAVLTTYPSPLFGPLILLLCLSFVTWRCKIQDEWLRSRQVTLAINVRLIEGADRIVLRGRI
ncbi:hypothetical protein E2C01_034385 [Portunus trituberculatus]|uniref:Uncharacterized protein n=1 Tax=Portunus trituberculatus TaxID=210409 RepID=A0A5B7F635_PORTR|nr:hypothetical protein [Portunus trituberculatus]